MNNIWLIVKREYFTRVKNKTFLLTTFLAPIAIVLFYAALGFVMTRGSDDVKEIAVIDKQNLLEKSLSTRDNLKTTFSSESLDVLLEKYKEGEIDGILELSPITDNAIKDYVVNFHSDDQLAMDESISLESGIRRKVRNFKLKRLNIDEAEMAKLDTDITINPKTVKSEKKVSSITSMVGGILGGIVGFVMFFIILIYGSQVMRSVMEEKINRIVEVLISSVKPFELMMGKVIGVGLVGLTQVGIWMIMIPLFTFIAASIFGISMGGGTAELSEAAAMIPQEEMDGMMAKVSQVMAELSQMNWWLIVPLFLFYFLVGYFAYAALFAALGSAVGEDVNEAQSLTIPVTLPLIFGMYIAMAAVNSPHSSLATWSSMIPLLSSVVMPVRLPADPPAWQIIVSMISLIIFAVFFVWLAARIYRVGILMYGKKASFKELAKWVFYKG